METRDIINAQGQKIGELTLPTNTAEDIWTERLAQYSMAGVPYLSDVTPRQIRQALVLSGVSLDSIDTALNSLPEPMKSLAKVEWEYSVAFKRNRPLVESMGQMLGWSSDQLDNLWKFAATL